MALRSCAFIRARTHAIAARRSSTEAVAKLVAGLARGAWHDESAPVQQHLRVSTTLGT